MQHASRAIHYTRKNGTWKAKVAAVRREMMGRGFALVATPRLFDSGLIGRRSITLLRGSSVSSKYPQLYGYASWLEMLVAEALPEEPLELTALEFRRERAGAEDQEIEKLHADGSYIRSILTLAGASTLYRAARSLHRVPPGQTLVLTALDRARAIGVPCTLHCRPQWRMERSLIVGSFEKRA